MARDRGQKLAANCSEAACATSTPSANSASSSVVEALRSESPSSARAARDQHRVFAARGDRLAVSIRLADPFDASRSSTAPPDRYRPAHTASKATDDPVSRFCSVPVRAARVDDRAEPRRYQHRQRRFRQKRLAHRAKRLGVHAVRDQDRDTPAPDRVLHGAGHAQRPERSTDVRAGWAGSRRAGRPREVVIDRRRHARDPRSPKPSATHSASSWLTKSSIPSMRRGCAAARLCRAQRSARRCDPARVATGCRRTASLAEVVVELRGAARGPSALQGPGKPTLPAAERTCIGQPPIEFGSYDASR